jgi:signal transduction histidine kinase
MRPNHAAACGVLVWLGLALPAACLPPASVAASPEPELPLQRIIDVQRLPAEALGSTLPVRVRGVVTFRGEAKIVIQDETGGIVVDFAAAAQMGLWAKPESPAGIELGNEVEVIGLASIPFIAPGLWPREVVNHGPGRLPAVRKTDAGRFFGGADSCMVVEFSGVVHRILDSDGYWRIILEADARRFSVFVSKTVLAQALGLGEENASIAGLTDRLVDAVVRVAGPSVSRPSTRGGSFEPQVNVSLPEWFTVVEPPAGPAFAAPFLPISMLSRQHLGLRPGHRLRTKGVVAHAVPGRLVFLEGGWAGVRVETESPERLRPGDEVEVAGFLAWRGPEVGLTDAVVRKNASVAAPAPIRLQKPFVSSFPPAGSRLVQIEASLLDVRTTPEGGELTLAADEAQINAVVSPEVFSGVRDLQPGSVLAVTGIGEVSWRFDTDRWPVQTVDAMRLLVRSPTDVRVVEPASFWSPARLTGLALVLAGGVAVSLAWVAALRREVRRQSALAVAEAMARRRASDEYEVTLRERGRIAADLHDTLLQTITGIGYQLQCCASDAAAVPSAAPEHIRVAQSLVGHASRQLRSTVWSLRSMPDPRQPFADAVGDMARLLAAGQGVKIDVLVTGAPVAVHETVARQLMFIVQEALLNAMHHGKAANVVISVAFAADGAAAEISIADDGCGFVPSHATGPMAGHFGIQGMRERAELLNGTFTLDTAVGRGTTVTVKVPMPGHAPALSWTDDISTESAA